jgi:hypothetical protein
MERVAKGITTTTTIDLLGDKEEARLSRLSLFLSSNVEIEAVRDGISVGTLGLGVVKGWL